MGSHSQRRNNGQPSNIYSEPPYGPSPSSSSSATNRYRTPQSSSSIRQTAAGAQPNYPASMYFSTAAGDDKAPPMAKADAPAHFAYSSTLRRNPEEHMLSPQNILSPHGHRFSPSHHDEGREGIWDRVVGTVRGVVGGGSERATENGYASLPKQSQEETASAKWSARPAEVRISLAVARRTSCATVQHS